MPSEWLPQMAIAKYQPVRFPPRSAALTTETTTPESLMDFCHSNCKKAIQWRYCNYGVINTLD